METIRDYTKRLALALKVVGLMNVQYAIQRDTVFVLEVNPRASRTVPYVSKATGVPLAKVAARLMTGRKLSSMNLPLIESDGVKELCVRDYYAVKSPVFPFNKFRGVDTILGPEMRSTGEVMGVAPSFGEAFAKAQLAAGQKLPRKGTISRFFLTVSTAFRAAGAVLDLSQTIGLPWNSCRPSRPSFLTTCSIKPSCWRISACVCT